MSFTPARSATLAELTRPVPNLAALFQTDCSHILAGRISNPFSRQRPDVAQNVRIHNLGRTVVSPSGVVFIEGIAVEETYRHRKFTDQQVSEMERIPTQGALMLDKAVLIDSPLPRNYQHFLFDYCARLLFAKSISALKDHVGLSINLPKQHHEILTALALPINDVLFNGTRWVGVERLVLLEQLRFGTYFSPQVVEAMRAFGASLPSVPESHPKHIYLSRRGTSRLRIKNEHELEAALVERGFYSLPLDDLTFREQASNFANARTIVSASDVALSNLPFCQRGSRVFELRSASQEAARPQVRQWKNLATVCGLEHEEIVVSKPAVTEHHAKASESSHADVAGVVSALRMIEA